MITSKIFYAALCSAFIIVSGFAPSPAGDCDLLAAPSNLNWMANSATSVSLSWDAVPGAISYQIKGRQLGTDNNGTRSTASSNKTLNGLPQGAGFEWAVRAKCADGSFSGYSNTDTFALPLPDGFCVPFIDMRDGKIYNTVAIGPQCWMADNLDFGLRIDGLTDMTDNSVSEKYCYLDNSLNCFLYGGLYQWNEVMNYDTVSTKQGMCPSGWHVPSHYEWLFMADQAGVSGTELQVGGDTGFDALMAGCRGGDGHFDEIGTLALFWTSTGNPINTKPKSTLRGLMPGIDSVHFEIANRVDGFSMRCIKD